ncbi:MAG: hypothetical protein ACKVP0_00845 [Pirellulaceae bacterium]
MKWSRWIVFSLASLTVIAANSAEPKSASLRISRSPVTPARYAADELDTAAPAAAVPRAGITPHAPVHYRSATWDIWSGTATGYVYSPGACDYTPPCVDHLWDGYEQRPHRCNPIHVHQWGHHGCGHCGSGGACGAFAGCDTCGSANSCGCGGHASRLKRAHGWHFGNKVCRSGCATCGDIAPSCGAPTCATPTCGYDGGKSVGPAPAPAPSDAETPPAPMPTADGEAPDYELPARNFESASPKEAARGKRLRGFTWPENSLQR